MLDTDSQRGSRPREASKARRPNSRANASSKSSKAPARTRRKPPSSPPRPGGSRARLLPGPSLSSRSPITSSHALTSPERADDINSRIDTSLDEDGGDMLNEVIMAVELTSQGIIGCAYYVAIDEALYLQEDIAMAGTEVVETLMLHAQPTTVLIPSRAPDILVDYLQGHAQGAGEHNQGGIHGAYILRTVGSFEFNYERAKDKLLNHCKEDVRPQSVFLVTTDETEIDDIDDGLGCRQNRLMRLSTRINLDSRLSISCAGAVLDYIQRRGAAEPHPDDPEAGVGFRIHSLKMFMLEDSMFVNADAMASLQILRPEYHPNSQMLGPDRSSPGAKENLSIYGLIQSLACTTQGKSRLRQMFLRPSVDIDLINERQRSIKSFIRGDNKELVVDMTRTLRKIGNIRRALTQIQRGAKLPPGRVTFRTNIWITVTRFCAECLALSSAIPMLSHGEDLQIVRKLLHDIDPQVMMQVGDRIQRCIDFTSSQEEQRAVIKPGIDEELDQMKRNHAGLGDYLLSLGMQMKSTIPEEARPYFHGCQFFPQLGFHVVVALNPETEMGWYEGEWDDQWQIMFINEGRVYCKSHLMRDMDEGCGDLDRMISDREIEISHELGIRTLEHKDALIAAADVCGEFDSLLALARSAEKYKWERPKMTTSNIIDIRGGRHPLQELVTSFIENDCRLEGGHGAEPEASVSGPNEIQRVIGPSMLVLTGPNHSGKSVYLKQVALIVYLAHIGSYVPAARAVIGLTDRLLTRVSTRESVARNESSFSIDLRQAAFSINFATRRSLILVDEFGKGTNAADGAGLLTGLMDHFLNLDNERPKVLVASHFHEIFENNFIREGPNLAFASMEVRLDEKCKNRDHQVVYLFKLVPKRSSSSFGVHCAALNGIDSAVVERAEALTLLQVRGEDLLAACARLTRKEERELEEAEAVARRFVQLDEELDEPRVSATGRDESLETVSARDVLGRVLQLGRADVDAWSARSMTDEECFEEGSLSSMSDAEGLE